MSKDKKRVLHISKYYDPFLGGTEKVARNCVRALRDSETQHYDQVVFCFDHMEHIGNHSGDVIDRVDGVRVVRCNCETKIASQSLSLSYGKRLKAIFGRFHPDIVVLHYPNPFATYYLLKLLEPDMKLVVFWHLDITRQKVLRYLFRGQNRELLRRADRVIAASPNYAQGSSWLSKVGEKCIIIPDCIEERKGCSIAKVQSLRRRYADRILCLAVGRHVEYKGFRYLIEAAGFLDDHFAIVITGQGPLTEKLKKQAREIRKKVSAKSQSCAEVIFTGLISDEELKVYQEACDIFCFPSITKNEAFGIALAEAMYCRKPAVTFTIEGSGVNFVSLNDKTGIECPNRDSKAYAKAIQKLAGNDSLRKQMGGAARERVESLFLYEQFAKNINRLFAELS